MFNDKSNEIMKKVYGVMKKISEWLAGFGADRYLHLLAGLVIAFFACMLMAATQGVSPWICALVAMAVAAGVGMGKEVLDQTFEGTSDGVDFAFTCIGGIIGCGLWMI